MLVNVDLRDFFFFSFLLLVYKGDGSACVASHHTSHKRDGHAVLRRRV